MLIDQIKENGFTQKKVKRQHPAEIMTGAD